MDSLVTHTSSIAVALIACALSTLSCGGKVDDSPSDAGHADSSADPSDPTGEEGKAAAAAYCSAGAHCGSSDDLAKCQRQIPCLPDLYVAPGLSMMATCAATTCDADTFWSCVDARVATDLPDSPEAATVRTECATAIARCGEDTMQRYCPITKASFIPPAIQRADVDVTIGKCLLLPCSDIPPCLVAATLQPLNRCP